MDKHCTIAARDFSAKTLRALKKRGLVLAYTQWLPGANGSFAAADACRGYVFHSGQILTFLEVKARAEAAAA